VRSFPRELQLDRAGVRFADMNGDAEGRPALAEPRLHCNSREGRSRWLPIFSRQVPQFDGKDPSVGC